MPTDRDRFAASDDDTVQDVVDDVPANHVPDRAILEAATASRATISSLGVAVIHEPDAF